MAFQRVARSPRQASTPPRAARGRALESVAPSEAPVRAGEAARALAGPVTPLSVLGLQRAFGNRAVGMLLRAPVQVRGRAAGRAVQRARPGEAPPTLQSQLTKRLSQMATEAGITPKMLLDETIVQLAAMVFPPPPAHPLEVLPMQTVIRLAVQAQLAISQAATPDVSTFKIHVAHDAMTLAERHGAALEELVPTLDAEIDPFAHLAERAVYTDPVRNSNAELRGLVGATTAGGKQLEKAARDHLAVPRGALAELDGGNRIALSQALRTMPVVQRMLTGTLGEEAAGNAGNVLLTGMDVAAGAALTEQLVNRVQEALVILEDLVEPGQLPPMGRVPHVEVNPDERTPIKQTLMEKLRGITRYLVTPFRANANRDDNKVRLSALDEVATIVHEFGHQVEFFLPVGAWLDIQDFLRLRHQGGNLVSIYPDAQDADVRNEAAFNADMPGTGLYSAKVYDDGSTELMSMSLEFFSRPDTAVRLIDADPLQAAIILRAVRPVEFKANVPQPLRLLLPRGDI